MECRPTLQERLVLIKQKAPTPRGLLLSFPLLFVFGTTALTQEQERPQTSKSPSSDTQEIEKEVRRLRMIGYKLSKEEAEALEKEVAAKPDDSESFALRLKLLGYYFSQRTKGPGTQTAQPHLLWIIRNHPGSLVAGSPECGVDKVLAPIQYEEAAKAWEEQVAKNPGNARIFGNAARFFLIFDSPRAEELLIKAETLEPNNKQWASQLGHLYALREAKGDPALDENRKKGLQAHLRALEGTSGEERFYQLDKVAIAAFKAGDLGNARTHADELLTMAQEFPKNWHYGNAIYTANSVLGQIALANDNLADARTFLLAAGDTPGSPQLNSFGPDLTLASALLAKGETKTVLAFFDKVSRFWKSGTDRIEAWKKRIEKGETPSLGRF
jgi:hypothetical protein